MIIRCSSALVEDVQLLGRTEEMFSRFMSQAKRENGAVMGHGLAASSSAGDDHKARPLQQTVRGESSGDLSQVDFRTAVSGYLQCYSGLVD